MFFCEPEENPPLLPKSRIRLGDRVKIMNPSGGQKSEGIVTGTTKSGGFLWVETGHGPPIRRIPQNLKIISSHHNNDNPEK